MMTSHFRPLKSCSCRMCKRGRRTKWGKQMLRTAEKKFRTHAKASLRRNPDTYEIVSMSAGYTD